MCNCASCEKQSAKGALIVQDPRPMLVIPNAQGTYTITNQAVLFIGTAPDEIKWSGDIIFPLTIVNQTADDIPLAAGYSYTDNEGNPQTSIPANSTVIIDKTNLNTFEQVSAGGGSGSGGSLTGNL